MAKRRIFTIYDKMDEDGVFDLNPANVQARSKDGRAIYKKAEYPRMVYHPKGEMRITTPGTAVASPFGPQWVGEQKELINRVCQDESEYAEAIASGWWNTPAEALSGVVAITPKSAETSLAEKDRRIKELEAALAARPATPPPPAVTILSK